MTQFTELGLYRFVPGTRSHCSLFQTQTPTYCSFRNM